ncbi:MAG: hypothetical protein U1F43_05980 [Myxococcota bacterium]
MLPTLAVLVALVASDPSDPSAPEIPSGQAQARQDYNAPWRQGHSRLSLGGGAAGFSGDGTDFYIGAAYGYFVVDNLELGIDAILTFGDAPFMARVGPSLTYIIPVQAAVQPYLGGFYRHWFIADQAFLDEDTLGAKLGVVIRSSGLFIQLGLVAEHTVSTCDEDCTAFYPEIGLSLTL